MQKRIALKVISLLVLAIVAVWVGLASEDAYAQSPDQPRGLERAIQVQEAYTDALMAISGVVGTGVTATDNGDAAVAILAARGGLRGLPATLDGVPVRVLVTGEIFALAPPDNPGASAKPSSFDTTARYRPAYVGISTGHPDITAGTIGARVTDGTNVYALSNNHVYANENNADVGDGVIQPGTYDGGSDPVDRIGNLADFQTIAFTTSANNVMDAAIALSSTALLGNATPPGGYGAPKSTPMEAAIGQPLKKYGRTTKLTKGKVYAINATVNIGYSSGTARFVGQIVITPGRFSAGGDSGSLIVDNSGGANDRRPVGLLFAGSPTVTIANPIGPVLTRFGVTIDGE